MTGHKPFESILPGRQHLNVPLSLSDQRIALKVW